MSEPVERCKNFRDVGEFVNLISGERLIPTRRLFRGGKLDSIDNALMVGNPGAILNLRRGHDRQTFGAQYIQVAASNDLEKYNTHNKEVRRWLNSVLKVFEDDRLAYPVLIHCTSGKDRTGVVVAAILRVLQTPEAVIVEEYLLSEGDVREEWIRMALSGIGDPLKYFHRVNLGKVRANILGAGSVAPNGGG